MWPWTELWELYLLSQGREVRMDVNIYEQKKEEDQRKLVSSAAGLESDYIGIQYSQEGNVLIH